MTTFTGHLKILNGRSNDERGKFLAENVEALSYMLKPQNLDELAQWLEDDVSHSKSAVLEVASNLLKVVRGVKDKLEALASTAKDKVAKFLAEALRVYNYAMHDSKVFSEFIGIIKTCEITIEGIRISVPNMPPPKDSVHQAAKFLWYSSRQYSPPTMPNSCGSAGLRSAPPCPA